jgi:methionine sulfoxide reductase heme-binding subunit
MLLSPSKTQIRHILKPAVFFLSVLPFALLALRILGIYGASLGANPIETVQDYLGVWGIRFLLISLAITPICWLIKRAWPLRLRRMLGLFAFFYCLMHFLTWLILDQSLDLKSIIEDIIKRPFITIGFIALALLIPLAVTSTQGWQIKLSKGWAKLHKLVYPIAILACWHYYWQVKLDTLDAFFYCLILFILLVIRVWKRKKL